MVKLRKEEKRFLTEHIDLFEKYDIDEAINELAKIYIKEIEDEESDLYYDSMFGCIIDFLAEDTDLFDHLTDDTCRLIMEADDEFYIVIDESYNKALLCNPYLTEFYFCIKSRKIKEIDCPHVKTLCDDDLYILDYANPKCVIKFPELDTSSKDKASCIYNFDNSVGWPNDLYVETNQKAIDNFIKFLKDDISTPREIEKVKKHLKAI